MSLFVCERELTWGIINSAFAAEREPPSAVRVPKIIYASRTHSQLAQVYRELQSTAYTLRASFVVVCSFSRSPHTRSVHSSPRAVTLASREQLCVHKEVSAYRGNVQNIMCRAHVDNNKCSYYLNYRGALVVLW